MKPGSWRQRHPHDVPVAEVPRGHFAPTIPDYALDMHTMKGKAMGRDLKHFRSEGAKLVPPPIADDPYENEAYRLWTIKQRR